MAVHPTHLRTNALVAPLGIDTPHPEFSWRLHTDEEGVVQSACAVQVSPTGSFEPADLVWDSGRVLTDRPFGVVYAGAPLASAQPYWWRVRLWDGAGAATDWSEAATFETAILDPARWRARWISGPAPASREEDTPVYLRGDVELPGEVASARAYVTALGWYRFLVNGTDLTGAALVPRWTPLDDVVEYQTYDVTRQLREGGNVLGLVVADGRYRGRLGAFGHRNVYGDRLAGFAQLEVSLTDGTTLVAATDATWRAGSGRVLGSDPMHGERVDLRVPDTDWLEVSGPPARFRPAEVLPAGRRRLIAEEVPRVRQVQLLDAVGVTRTPSGKQLVDFGQNFTGVVRIRVSGRAGTRVRLTHGELTTRGGELDTTSFLISRRRPWYQRDELVLDGTASWYQPWFTIHGFRYVEVDGLDHDLRPEDVQGVVLSSDLPPVGSFECSDTRLERLYHNVVWGLRSNFTDTPTDCPTRERSGWTGDIQVFGPAATTIVDAQAYLRRYLANLALEQRPDGTVPPFVPSETSEHATSPAVSLIPRLTATAVGWGDVTVLLPWTLYTYYGDTEVLRRQYPTMTRWVDHLEHVARTRTSLLRSRRPVEALERYIVDTGFHWGEWLRPGEEPKDALKDLVTNRANVATAYFAHSSEILARIAAVIGHDRDAQRYAALAGRVKQAWQAAFVRRDGRIGSDRQDDYVRALAFDLLPAPRRAEAVQRLARLVELAGTHLGTGFLSTPMLLPVLAEYGRADLAFRLLLQTTNPSWLYQVERGATTVWESWEGYDQDGNGKASHNHYAFGSVAGWLQEGLAGLSPAQPGYRVIRIAPVVGGGLTRVSKSLDTPFGPARSTWQVRDGTVQLEVVVPAGAEAEVHLGESGETRHVGSGTHQFSWKATPQPATTSPRA